MGSAIASDDGLAVDSGDAAGESISEGVVAQGVGNVGVMSSRPSPSSPRRSFVLSRWLQQRFVKLMKTFPRDQGHLDLDNPKNPGFWKWQLANVNDLIELVEAASEEANTLAFARSLIELIASLVEQRRSQMYIAGLELLVHPKLICHPAIVIEAIALVTKKSLSGNSRAVRQLCDQAITTLVAAQPNKHALKALIDACNASRCSSSSYPALPTVAKGLIAFVDHHDGLCLQSASLVAALVNMLVAVPGDVKETRENAKQAVVILATKERGSYERILAHPNLQGLPMLTKELRRLVVSSKGPTPDSCTSGRTPYRTPGWRRHPFPKLSLAWS
jgi:hypothetical protein